MLGLYSSETSCIPHIYDEDFSTFEHRFLCLMKYLDSFNENQLFVFENREKSLDLAIPSKITNIEEITLHTQNNITFHFPSIFKGYKFLKNISNGGYSSIIMVTKIDTNQKYAAKIIPFQELDNNSELENFQNEIGILSSIENANIIKYYESFTIKNEEGNEYLVIITEYCEQGTLLNYILHNEADDRFLKKIFYQISKAIEYLHDLKISHGDIKLENILLDENFTPKLCDFGFAKKILISKDSKKYCTLKYASPELLKFGSYNTQKADIWALGISFYVADSKSFPFNYQSSIKDQILRGKELISPKSDLQELAARCTQMNPRKRPTIKEILQDKYFQ